MNSISNSVTLIGNLGRDVETNTTSNGGTVANFSLATTSRYTNKAGERVEETEWHRCVAFGKTADILGQYGQKGNKLALQGRIKYGKYTDKDGVERNSTDIIVSEFVFLGSKSDNQAEPQPIQASTAPASAPPAEGADDDLPF